MASTPTNNLAGTWPRTRHHEGHEPSDLEFFLSPDNKNGRTSDASADDAVHENPVVRCVMRRYASDAIFDNTPDIDLSKTDPEFFITDEEKASVIVKKINKRTIIWNNADEYFLTGNTSGVYTRGSRTLPTNLHMKKESSDGNFEPSLSVDEYNSFEQSFKPRMRQRSSLTSVFNKVNDDIVDQEDYADLDSVFAVPEIPDDISVHGSTIEDPYGATSFLKSKKMLFREVSSNIQLPRKSSNDSNKNDIKTLGVSKINFNQVGTSNRSLNKSFKKLLPHVHRRVQICRQDNAIDPCYTIHPSKLDLRRNSGLKKIVNGKSDLPTVKMARTQTVPFHPRVELICKGAILDCTKSMYPSELHLRTKAGDAKVHLKKTSLCTATLATSTMKNGYCNDILVNRTYGIHPSGLHLRTKAGCAKVHLKNTSLSTVTFATSTMKNGYCNDILVNRTYGIHPSKLHLLPKDGFAKVYPKKTSLSTVTCATSTMKNGYCNDILVNRTYGVHPSKLHLLPKDGVAKVDPNKTPLSTISDAVIV